MRDTNTVRQIAEPSKIQFQFRKKNHAYDQTDRPTDRSPNTHTHTCRPVPSRACLWWTRTRARTKSHLVSHLPRHDGMMEAPIRLPLVMWQAANARVQHNPSHFIYVIKQMGIRRRQRVWPGTDYMRTADDDETTTMVTMHFIAHRPDWCFGILKHLWRIGAPPEDCVRYSLRLYKFNEQLPSTMK